MAIDYRLTEVKLLGSIPAYQESGMGAVRSGENAKSTSAVNRAIWLGCFRLRVNFRRK
jgi:hypothetical protein